jgi:hypothetical protein
MLNCPPVDWRTCLDAFIEGWDDEEKRTVTVLEGRFVLVAILRTLSLAY